MQTFRDEQLKKIFSHFSFCGDLHSMGEKKARLGAKGK
jgi:hypothetical protein